MFKAKFSLHFTKSHSHRRRRVWCRIPYSVRLHDCLWPWTVL